MRSASILVNRVETQSDGPPTSLEFRVGMASAHIVVEMSMIDDIVDWSPSIGMIRRVISTFITRKLLRVWTLRLLLNDDVLTVEAEVVLYRRAAKLVNSA
ncbi:hypothetical protein [Rhizobium leguminosarum]|uniref:hypothetical protein n=1 Tax=Rhizobium leguminosarum TaxID=384 RepID=UPI001AE6081C|nr:hypothetical protein [Rhizobium leguminosarum]MBP2446999.1 hypothetical protein [Rhizobium leguminosarum]